MWVPYPSFPYVYALMPDPSPRSTVVHLFQGSWKAIYKGVYEFVDVPSMRVYITYSGTDGCMHTINVYSGPALVGNRVVPVTIPPGATHVNLCMAVTGKIRGPNGVRPFTASMCTGNPPFRVYDISEVLKVIGGKRRFKRGEEGKVEVVVNGPVHADLRGLVFVPAREPYVALARGTGQYDLELQVYVDGRLVESRKVSPGRLTLSLPTDKTGRHRAEFRLVLNPVKVEVR